MNYLQTAPRQIDAQAPEMAVASGRARVSTSGRFLVGAVRVYADELAGMAA